MSVGDGLRGVAHALRLVICGLMGWVFIAPVALLMPRRRDQLVVISTHAGQFTGNAKYFFLQATPLLRPDVRVVFLTEYPETEASLRAAGLDVLRYPSWRCIWYLLRTSAAVVDSGDWLYRMRRFLMVGAKVVQLWHGVGFKRVDLDKMRHEQRRWLSSRPVMALRLLNGAINGKLVRYAAFVSPSRFYEQQVFRRAFLARHFLIAGYPRNTFGRFDSTQLRETAWLNVDESIRDKLPLWQSRGRRMVLVVPTFRETRATSLGIDADTAAMLDTWCDSHGVELLFKFHPFERGTAAIAGRHLHLLDPATDPYPLMALASALVTDYSSIYMDFLLLDRPVLFLVPDLDEYIQRDRQIQFDFNDMTPGPKAVSWQQLLHELDAEWEHDHYAGERKRLRELAFDDLDARQAVPAIIDFMRNRGWIGRGGTDA
jgi:CDP-glycerol glycerophosphotransferase (TagB/SpsB family)